MRFFLLFCLALGLAQSLVEFANSALYDIYDFKGVDEVHITKCDFGCLIFSATVGDGFEQYPEQLDPYALNLIVFDNDKGKGYSIAKLAQQQDKNQQKIPLTITGRGNISVKNHNDPDEWNHWTIVLFVIEKPKADEFSYEVYDCYYNRNRKITPQSDIVTFLSSSPFRVQAQPTTQANSVTARLVGFDNALDSNKDGCPYAYKTPEGQSFPGFSIITSGPILSLALGKRNAIQLQLDGQFNSVRDLGVDGFVASAGWNGCSKPSNGGFQSFRPREGTPAESIVLSNNVDSFNVSVDVLPNFNNKRKLYIGDRANANVDIVVKGTVPQHFDIPNANYLTIDYTNNMWNDQGFLLRYSSTLIPKKSNAKSSSDKHSMESSQHPAQSQPPLHSNHPQLQEQAIDLLVA